MVDLYSSQFVLKRLNLQQAHQHANPKDFTWHTFNDASVGFKTSHASPHSFVVDWQIPESEKGEKTHEFITA